jgi:predicted ATPase/DNA-binding SARP family transcriptional activator
VESDDAASPFSIRLLGPFEVCCNGQPVPRLRYRKGQAVLTLLCLRHGCEVERDWLVGVLWPDSDHPAALHSLRNCLTVLRRTLGPEAGRLHSPNSRTLAFDLTNATVDVLAFDAAIARGDREGLEEAVTLYRGPLLEGCAEEWAFQERQPREQAYLTALERLAALALTEEDAAAAESYLRRAVAVDPLRESAQRSLIEALGAGGNYAAALLTYQELRLRLYRELNAEPDPETQALFQRLRVEAQGKSASGRSSGQSEDLRPQVARQAVVPPLRLPLTRFFGREEEIARLLEWLQEPATRLVTLTGPGGCGKTRLALQVGLTLLEAYDGAVWFAPLLDLSDPRLIPDKLLQSLRLSHPPQSDPLEQIAAALSARPGLLILDNFEHLIEGGVGCVQALLEEVRMLTILVTSRRCLGVPGEREYPVTPLPVPDLPAPALACDHVRRRAPQEPPAEPKQGFPAALLRCTSVQLFVDRAQAVQVDFQLTAGNATAVVGLCQRLEGIPLAIELAAARVRVLTPRQMLERLEQRFELLVGCQRSADPRHRSLRATLDWSYQLLSPELQRFFARLSVFRGGWTLEAAEAVCEEPRALEFLEELRQCSLVVTEAVGEEMRYRLLEMLREYGAGQLTTKERTTLAQQHLAYYRDRFENEKGMPGVGGRTIQQRLDEVEREQDNLRVALDGWVQSGGALGWMRQSEGLPYSFIRLMSWFWRVRGYTQEGRQRVAEILALPGAAVPSLPRAWLLISAGELARQQGDFAAAGVLFQESLTIYQELGDTSEEAECCNVLANLARDQGDYLQARCFHKQMLALARKTGDERNRARGLYGMGYTAYLEGNIEAAHSLLEEGLQILRKGQEAAWASLKEADDHPNYGMVVGHLMELAWACEHLGEVADARGEYASARAHLEESLVIFREFGFLRYAASVLCKLGRIARHQGLWSAAAAHFCESLAFWQQDGDKQGIAVCLEGLGAVAAGQGEAERAARLLGAVATLRQSRGYCPPPVERADLDGVIAAVRVNLGEVAFASARAEGEAMPLEQVIAEALQEAPVG